MLNVIVPLAMAALLGAVRVIRRRTGRVVLAEHEAMGGYTILKHVGKTEFDLRARLAIETNIPVASTFSSLRMAENVISEAMRREAPLIRRWTTGPRASYLRLSYVASKDIGFGVVRRTGNLLKMQKIRVVLKSTQMNGKLCFILTSFPIP